MTFILDNLVWIILVLIVVCLVLAIVKKLLKLAIIFAVVSVLLTSAGVVKNKIQENYSINVNGSVVEYKIQGNEGSIDMKEIQEVQVSKGEDGGNSKITFVSKSGYEYSVEVPKIAWSVVKGKFEQAGAVIKEVTE